ncbi:MAG: hypothetical protein K0R90_494, partial [Oscillospiraceae bacterium]|nr:hypothetical protein [Oscillospiraceae bacterium]
MEKKTLQKLTQASMIAALYAVLTLAVAPISFGNMQFRISEALTILPLFTAVAIPGLTVGCALANFIGFIFGLNQIGFLDIFFGSAATLIAAIVTYMIGKST